MMKIHGSKAMNTGSHGDKPTPVNGSASQPLARPRQKHSPPIDMSLIE